MAVAHFILVRPVRAITAATAIFVASTGAYGKHPSPSPSPAQKIVLNETQARELELNAPQPLYPDEARKRRIAGSGIFKLRVRLDTGSVVRVDVVRSTGSQILDEAALEAFRKWRFAPALMRQMRRRLDPADTSKEDEVIIPVTFKL